MPCCGQTRKPLAKRRTSTTTSTPTSHRPAATQGVAFTYIGRGGVTAVGPITGRRYRFARPGVRVAVDVRDAPSLMAVPGLRKLPL